MYICICHGISDSSIRQALDNGARHYRDVANRLGAGDCCGQCVQDVKDIISEYKQQSTGAYYATPVIFQPA